MHYRDIYPGDRVIDQIDGSLRTVKRVIQEDPNDPHDSATVHMNDGGIMNSEDIDRVYPEPEIVPKTEFY